MWNPWLTIAAFAVGIVFLLLTSYAAAELITSYTMTGQVHTPQYIIDLAEKVTNAAIAVLGGAGVVGGLAQWRKNRDKKNE